MKINGDHMIKRIQVSLVMCVLAGVMLLAFAVPTASETDEEIMTRFEEKCARYCNKKFEPGTTYFNAFINGCMFGATVELNKNKK